jgi:AraC family transcriptional regulator, regulatory protein of adaptative response / DNA-3-methyladenine glycosylase II
MVDDELAYRAVQSRDTRFDGQFFTGVATTRIYCRPSCPARTPRRQNVHFFSTAAAAQSAGYRACKRCRPDESPGSPQWNLRADTAARAVVMVSDGVVDREGVTGLARRLGYSERQLRQHLKEELGVAPLELARARRSAAALALLENTAMSVTEIAFASGFSSVRQFNEALRDAFDESPTSLRRHRQSNPTQTPSGTIDLSLPVRQPYCLSEILQFLRVRAVAGVEEFADGWYRRVLRLPRSVAIVSIDAAQDGARVQVRLELDDVRDLSAAVNRVSQLLDLHADPGAISAVLERDPLLALHVAANPGRRVPGHPDSEELAIRAVLGQQISVAAARNLASRLVEAYGEPLARPSGTLCRSFPTSASLSALDTGDLPMPKARQQAVIGLARALAEGSIDLSPGADRHAAQRGLLTVPGIGGWTAAYVRMRGLGDPDAFLATDLGVRRAFEARALSGDPRSVTSRAEGWRPWRAYALMHLWASLAVPTTSPSRHEQEQP